MPNSQQHREKAERNRRFLDSLDDTADPDWAAVVAFYTALHLIERLASCDSAHHGGHTPRRQYLTRHTKHRAINSHYQVLYDAAHMARYGTLNQFRTAYPGDTVRRRLIDTHLVAIERYVEAHFAPTSPT